MIIQKTKLVEFFSDFNGFRVVMKNLNYDFIKNLNNRESTIKTEIKKRKILEVQIQKIMEFFETNNELTRKMFKERFNAAKCAIVYGAPQSIVRVYMAKLYGDQVLDLLEE